MRSHAQSLYWQLGANIENVNRLMMYQTDGRIDMVNERQLNIYVNWLKAWMDKCMSRKEEWETFENMEWPPPPEFPFDEFFAAGEDMTTPLDRDTHLLPPWSSPRMINVLPYFITRRIPKFQQDYQNEEQVIP